MSKDRGPNNIVPLRTVPRTVAPPPGDCNAVPKPDPVAIELLGLLDKIARMVERGEVTSIAAVLQGPLDSWTAMGGDVRDGVELIGSFELAKQRAVMRVIAAEPKR